MNEHPHYLVAAGLIWRTDGQVLISRRLDSSAHAGCWELPGGKVEEGETVSQALVREIQEELAVVIEAGTEFNRVTHDYGSYTVTLVGLHARFIGGEPQALGVAEWRWIDPAEMLTFTFPPANTRLFEAKWNEQPQ
ncbi:MAG TPA: (deoxy)nucleoside triphosphate pyrophosphohydrolase [Bacteroidetes bacterium]|nr:CTP pyrophosphohydrolase [bacterium BMS3Bbin04]HDO65019.1 (deoxy)nucleoside triphosphate pyrophosphohydrolase [Bacteroidota bacterium]HEX04144.1 (deoxy)nucleoside triphosphate pyrophosphohydrolase [Bacteroidota bacterium]